jgi:hypothetical protein
MRSHPVVRIAAGLLVLLMSGLLLPAASYADDDDDDWRGIITARPDGTAVGSWTVGGRTFSVTTATRLRQREGPLELGACAEVEYRQSGSELIALEIESERASRCGGDDDDDDDDDRDAGSFSGYGLLQARPAGISGSWRIGGNDFTATTATETDNDHGPLTVGVCAEYEAVTLDGVNRLLEVESAEGYKCSGGSGSTQRTIDVVSSLPAELVGAWQIGTTVFTATTATRFEQDEGPFIVGGCVAVRHAAGDTTATAIKTVEAYRCSGAVTTPVARLYGLIETVPEPLTGSWTIGGTQFSVTAATELDTEDGELLPQSCAGVKYATVDGVNTALEIEAESLAKCQPNSFRSRLRGVVTLMPADRYGSWLIDGTAVEAVTATRFDTEDGPLAVGVCVEAKYVVREGVNIASEIESDDDCDGGSGGPSARLFGLIEAFPPAPFSGSWTIGGVEYRATAATEFEQDDGRRFAVGACVEAKFTTVNGVLTLREVETKHPLRCGDGSSELRAYGVIEVLPEPIGAGSWTIGGIDYTATVSTSIVEEHGLLAIGAFVEVRYQVETDGTLTALSIETHVAPGDGADDTVGELEVMPEIETGTWEIDGVSYVGDPAIVVDLSEAALQGRSGRSAILTVAVNSYRGLDGVNYATAIMLAEPPLRLLFIPSATR